MFFIICFYIAHEMVSNSYLKNGSSSSSCSIFIDSDLDDDEEDIFNSFSIYYLIIDLVHSICCPISYPPLTPFYPLTAHSIDPYHIYSIFRI